MPKLSKDIRTQDILQIAMLEFVEKGYYQTTMEIIALKAGVTKSALYQYFKNKEEILLQANKKYREPIAEMLHHLAVHQHVGDGLKYFIKSYLEYWSTHKKEVYFFNLSMAKMLKMRDLSAYHAQASETMIGLFEDIYRKGIRKGTFVDHNPKNSAVSLLSALNGSLTYLSMSTILGVSEVIDHFSHQFVGILMKHP